MVNSVKTGRPNYNATKCGAVAGAAAGAVGTASLYSSYNSPKTLVKYAKTISDKKKVIKMFQDGLSKVLEIDFSKNTVSKFCKEVQESIRKPSMIAGIMTVTAGVGAVMGLAVDCVKNRKAKKA